MARTIKDIQQGMVDDLTAQRPGLSPSAASEWRLWTWVVATAIHLFEVVMDTFRKEMDEVTDRITPGTVRWYADQCRRFQNGHELLFDEQTAQLYYEREDHDARIIDVVAVTEGLQYLSIKVAKIDEQNKIVPLTSDELLNFSGYINAIKFAGTEVVAVSTNADKIRYDMEVFYDPTVPMTVVRERVVTAMDAFRAGQDFNSMLYEQKLVTAVMAVDGVVTADLKKLERKGTSMTGFEPVRIAEELEAGYFDYASDCKLTFTSSTPQR